MTPSVVLRLFMEEIYARKVERVSVPNKVKDRSRGVWKLLYLWSNFKEMPKPLSRSRPMQLNYEVGLKIL